MRSIKLPSWTEGLLGLTPVGVPPHVFALERDRLTYARFHPDSRGLELREHLTVDLEPGLFPDGPLAGAARDPERLGEAVDALLEAAATTVREASLVLPDPWLRVAFTEAADVPSRGAQRGYYRLLQPGETAEWSERYRVPNRAYRLLRVFVGVIAAMPSEAEPYPWFADEFERRRFAIPSPARGAFPEPALDTWRRYWDFDLPIGTLAERIGIVADSLAGATDTVRARLRHLLRWDRDAASEFAPELMRRESLGPYRVHTLRIAGEPDVPIDLQLLRRGAFDVPLSTVIYLSGNPPGTKTSGTVPAMILADLGLQVASVDRRLTARRTEHGEFLANIADPVFDARRLVDYLLTLSDVAAGVVSVCGFSLSAFEGMFLTALHPDVGAAVLASRIVDHDSLFSSDAWAPTLWSPEVIEDVGLGALIGNWDALWDALTPEVGDRAAAAYRARYPFFDAVNPRIVLPLVAPKPVLVVTGARDAQFPLGGVLAVDSTVRERYDALEVERASALYIMPRAGHRLTPVALDMTAQWLRLWTGRRPPD